MRTKIQTNEGWNKVLKSLITRIISLVEFSQIRIGSFSTNQMSFEALPSVFLYKQLYQLSHKKGTLNPTEFINTLKTYKQKLTAPLQFQVFPFNTKTPSLQQVTHKRTLPRRKSL
jgi:hypothetical protein